MPGRWMDQLYAAVDDVAFGKVTIDLAPWPRLSKTGHLVFGDELPRLVVDREYGPSASSTRGVRSSVRRPEIDSDRRCVSLHSRRAVTIRSVRSPTGFYVEEDITEHARKAAKVALYGAVAGWLSPEEAERLPDKYTVQVEDVSGPGGSSSLEIPAPAPTPRYSHGAPDTAPGGTASGR